MKGIRKALVAVAKALGILNARRVKLRQHWRVVHHMTIHAHNVQLRHQAKADEARKNNEPTKAAYHDQRAVKAKARATARHARAEHLVTILKRVNQQIEGLTHKQEELRQEAEQYKATHSLHINRDTGKVTGGHPEQCLGLTMRTAMADCSAGQRHNYYDQGGRYEVTRALRGGPAPGRDRSDCSSEFASWYWASDLDDPSGENYLGGYTGTLGTHGAAISREAARTTTGAAVLFGTAPYHHVEGALGDGTEETAGHGSGPVDKGNFSLLPGPVAFRKYVHI